MDQSGCGKDGPGNWPGGGGPESATGSSVVNLSGRGSAGRIGKRQRLERFRGRALDDGAVQRVSGAVAGAVPGVFGVVVGHRAAEMGTPGRQGGQLSTLVAAQGGEVAADGAHGGLAGTEVGRGVGEDGAQPVADEVFG